MVRELDNREGESSLHFKLWKRVAGKEVGDSERGEGQQGLGRGYWKLALPQETPPSFWVVRRHREEKGSCGLDSVMQEPGVLYGTSPRLFHKEREL